LGDGTSSASAITNIDKEIIDYLKTTIPDMEMELKRRKIKGEDTICYYMKGIRRNNNVFLQELQNSNMINNKHIPHKYKFTSRENRLNLLAGLVDTDGSLALGNCYDIIQKSTVLANDIVFISRSCGLAITIEKCRKGCWYKEEYKEDEYNRMCISGEIKTIPVLIPRKKATKRKQIKSVLNVGFVIESVEKGRNIFLKTTSNNRILLGRAPHRFFRVFSL
jgi:hypothetical protein